MDLVDSQCDATFRQSAKKGLAMNTATLNQVRKVLELMETVSKEQVQAALESGSLIRALRGEIKTTFTEFFRTRSGLWVSDEFRKRALAKASGTGVVRESTCYVLPRGMTDAQIEAELPENHLWDEDDLCATVAHLIGLQPNGKEGKLLNNGYLNLFYTSSCVVDVLWNADVRTWSVNTWYRDDRRWGTGDQVFFPATDA